jgi:hypothetical protein
VQGLVLGDIFTPTLSNWDKDIISVKVSCHPRKWLVSGDADDEERRVLPSFVSPSENGNVRRVLKEGIGPPHDYLSGSMRR